MPTCRRKKVVLTEPSDALIRAAKDSPEQQVYYLQQTGEIFETYEYVPTLPSTPHTPSDLLLIQSLRCAHVILPTEAVSV